MKCPVCGNAMVEKNFGVRVDVCENGCKSIWFDQNELQMLDEKHEGLGEDLEAALNYPKRNDENRGQIVCTKCNIPMQIHKYKRSKQVNVDECYQCGGFLLDSGELKEIRETYLSDAEVTAYLNQMLKTIPDYVEASAKLEMKKTRTEAVKKLTKFLRFSYWLKQRQV